MPSPSEARSAEAADLAVGRSLRLVDRVWQELRRRPFFAQELGSAEGRIPELSEAEAQRISALGREISGEIDAIDRSMLPAELATTLDVARDRAAVWAREADWYWLVHDPMGVGFFALFSPTAYCGGFLVNQVRQTLAGMDTASTWARDRYLAMVSGYARLVGQMTARTEGQAARGIRIPGPQLAQSRRLLTAFRDSAPAAIAGPRLEGAPSGFRRELEARVQDVVGAYQTFLDLLGPNYGALAPEAVGMHQYPGGPEVYAELVGLHTTLPLSPQDVHDRGVARMADVRRDMATLFAEIGFEGTAKDYLAAVARDPAWRAATPDAIQTLFRRYIERIRPELPNVFHRLPAADHDAAPLPDTLSDSMTFGFYSIPTPGQEKGLYMFNARNLAAGPLPNIAALNYHELVPGHHLHLSTQQEFDHLHPLRQNNFVNAFNEGWAEYAATLAGEMGMYSAPEERFGRLMMDAFLTCRLVVDTGMNALGWDLARARAYMRENGFVPETEIDSESIRYSCDIPGQSLAYKLGDTHLMAARERMRARLGSRFDIRDFHDAVLRPGALPLELVSRNVERATEAALAEGSPST
jgi:uncharacterized protein (DUF885 family)